MAPSARTTAKQEIRTDLVLLVNEWLRFYLQSLSCICEKFVATSRDVKINQKQSSCPGRNGRKEPPSHFALHPSVFMCQGCGSYIIQCLPTHVLRLQRHTHGPQVVVCRLLLGEIKNVSKLTFDGVQHNK